MATLYEIRDSVMLIHANWLSIDKTYQAELKDKTDVKGRFNFWERIQHACGYGSWGYHTLNKAVSSIIKEALRDIVEPHLQNIRKIQEGKIEELSWDEIHSIIIAMDNVDKIELIKRGMLLKIRSKFFGNLTTVGKCILIITGVFEYIRSFILKTYHKDYIPYISSEQIKKMSFNSHQHQKALFEKKLQPLQDRCLLWNGTDRDLKLEMYLVISPYSEQIILYRNQERIGSIVFCGDWNNEAERTILKLTYSYAKDQDAQDLLTLFLTYLALKGNGIHEDISCAPNTFDLKFKKEKSYDNGQFCDASLPKLQAIEKIILDAQKKSVFLNLIPISDICKAIQAIQ